MDFCKQYECAFKFYKRIGYEESLNDNGNALKADGKVLKADGNTILTIFASSYRFQFNASSMQLKAFPLPLNATFSP